MISRSWRTDCGALARNTTAFVFPPYNHELPCLTPGHPDEPIYKQATGNELGITDFKSEPKSSKPRRAAMSPPFARSLGSSGIILSLLATMLMASPAVVEASVVDSGTIYTYNGTDWPIAYDQTNDLYWLNLGATKGMSVNNVAASSLPSDWQYARKTQVESFLDSVAGNTTDLDLVMGGSSSKPALESLWSFWEGIETANSFYVGIITNDVTSPTTAGDMGWGWASANGTGTWYTRNPWSESSQSLAWTDANEGVWLASSTNPGTSSSSPQSSTPLPPTAALFPVGIAFMEWNRRRKVARLAKSA